MGSKWRKVKRALGLKLCAYVPRISNNEDDYSMAPEFESHSEVALLSPATDWTSAPPTPGASGLKLSKSLSKSSKKTCSICLASIKQGDGLAIFTAECSHSFHFQCIASNVKHGHQICPICRAKWKEVPFRGPSLDPPPGRARVNPVDLSQNNDLLTVIQRLPPCQNPNRNINPLSPAPEPALFNDDESLDHASDSAYSCSNKDSADCDGHRSLKIITYPELQGLPQFAVSENFDILIHLKAPASVSGHYLNRTQADLVKVCQSSRAPVDLVTVLDVSGSMAGTKLALLKRAMGFVIQNLGPNDRLAIIAFSSMARRLFPLRRMSESGRHQALQAVNSLVANGGTNIPEGLRKGAKVMEDRRERNPVGSIILLSDGRDTYTVSNATGNHHQPNYELLLPLSIRCNGKTGSKVPVHTFGFGADHDASSMHSISEISGGTFSFIETEGVIQDAFAQCIGGLLSVVVQDLLVSVDCGHPAIRLVTIRAGSYQSRLMSDGHKGSIDVGDLYADEERDFLVSVSVPTELSSKETSLLKVTCSYKDPLINEMVTPPGANVTVMRSEATGQETISIEVDRQRNRLHAAEAMTQARSAAEKGDLVGASSIIENCRKVLMESVSARCQDRLCVALEAELKEMQERMTSRHVYEASGRAYILSGLSSHSWQRATARGDSTESSSLIHAYKTPSMVEMVTRSQATLLGSPALQRLVQPVFASRPKPR